ncbi:hypothetical protein DYU05_04005 [Mucilaginibacter terrenus]|uniref:Uncharacterized protein n=1 Tax=Mucilaginibacter terrenus TaxID=2482727 RepID=A0A3E2NUX9_9SPHI|nr:hypothetical protein [Mucilaginibacter terrenus]RFZ84779.1 hypothetical protein DYU05_04005 [Mucilaginibacter terrenus]
MEDNSREPVPEFDNYPVEPVETVTVPANQLQALIEQNAEIKADILILVNVLNGLQGLFSGKASLMSIVPVITKLINDQRKLKELSAIVPVLEKYIAKPKQNEQ